MPEPKPPIEYDLDHLQCCLDHLWDFLEAELKLLKLLGYATLLAVVGVGLLVLGRL